LRDDIIRRHAECEDIDVSGDDLDLVQGMAIIETNKTLLQRDIDVLEQIADALERFESGTYGLCEECDEKIAIRRLQVKPYTKCCVSCQEELEYKSAHKCH
jgi:DnaK suppressor protein